MAGLRALAVAAAGALLFILGTPGLDYLSDSELATPAARAEAVAAHGPLGHLAIAILDLDRQVRTPLAKALGGIQPVFRIRQSWHLYRNGPGQVRRLEITVDGERVYLTGSASHRWRVAQLRSRRMRPVAETAAMKTFAQNPEGLARWITEEARGDFPEAQEVQLRAWWGPWPGDTLSLHHAWVMVPPAWEPELVEP